MRVRFIVTMLLFAAMLTGCKIVDEVNTSLQYATDAAAFLNEAQRFAQEVPALAEQAIADPATIEALRREFASMRDAAAEFRALNAPAIAEELHKQLVKYSEQISAQLEEYIRQIDEKVIDLEALANAPMLETIRNMTELMSQIEQLGL